MHMLLEHDETKGGRLCVTLRGFRGRLLSGLVLEDTTIHSTDLIVYRYLLMGALEQRNLTDDEMASIETAVNAHLAP